MRAYMYEHCAPAFVSMYYAADAQSNIFFFFFKGKFSISALPNLIRPSFFILFFSTNNNLYRMSHLKRNNRAGLDKTRKYGSIKWTAR